MWFISEKMSHLQIHVHVGHAMYLHVVLCHPSFFSPNGGMDIRYVLVKDMSSINENQHNKTLTWKHLSELHDITKWPSSHEGLKSLSLCTPTIIVTWKDSHTSSDLAKATQICEMWFFYTISPMLLNGRRVTHSRKKFQLWLKHSYIHMNNWTCFATFSILPLKLSHCWMVVITLCLH